MTVTGDGPENDRDVLDDGVATVAELDADGRPGTPPPVRDVVAPVAP